MNVKQEIRKVTGFVATVAAVIACAPAWAGAPACCVSGNCCASGKCYPMAGCCKADKSCCDAAKSVCAKACGCLGMTCCGDSRKTAQTARAAKTTVAPNHAQRATTVTTGGTLAEAKK